MVHCVYIFGGSCLLTEFCLVHNSVYAQVLCSPILGALLHGTPAAASAKTLRRGTRNGIAELSQTCHLYSAGRPSRWASAYILVHLYYVVHQNIMWNRQCNLVNLTAISWLILKAEFVFTCIFGINQARWARNSYPHMCSSFIDLTVKTALQSVNIWQSYRQKSHKTKLNPFYGSRCRLHRRKYLQWIFYIALSVGDIHYGWRWQLCPVLDSNLLHVPIICFVKQYMQMTSQENL